MNLSKKKPRPLFSPAVKTTARILRTKAFRSSTSFSNRLNVSARLTSTPAWDTGSGCGRATSLQFPAGPSFFSNGFCARYPRRSKFREGFDTGDTAGSRTYKPNSVRRIAPEGTVIPLGRHYSASSDLPGGCGAPSRHAPGEARVSPPIWSCSVWGFPCPPCHHDGGALLPHLFTLTLALQPRRYLFCGTFRRPALEPGLPDVIRHTALWSPDFPPLLLDAVSDRPVQLPTDLL